MFILIFCGQLNNNIKQNNRILFFYKSVKKISNDSLKKQTMQPAEIIIEKLYSL